MKIKMFKNNIAFTLMEMTLVLLITSIIAAASTPILTSAVVKATTQNSLPTSIESADVVWRNSESYDGQGIYNAPVTNTSMVGVNTKFGAYSEAYNYPSLVVENTSGHGLFNAPQIQNVTTSYYSNFAMDEYENISIAAGNNSYKNLKISNTNQDADKPYIGYKSVFIGTNLLPSPTLSKDDIYFENSIILGQNINSKKAVHSVTIGSNINKIYNDSLSVLIGSNITQIGNDSAAYAGTVQIVPSAPIGMPAINSVRIGTESSTYSSSINDISIGNAAGYNFDIKQKNGFDRGTYNNILIGNYVGSSLGAFTSPSNADQSYAFSNIIIGDEAGSIRGAGEGRAKVLIRNIIIGEDAASITNNTSQSLAYVRRDEINIGSKAGRTAPVVRRNRNVNIGTNAVLDNEMSFDDSINIGYYAGYGAASASLDKSIRISTADSALYATHSAKNSISIGYGANMGHRGNYAIAIGYQANKNTYANAMGYGNVAIGNNTCNINLGGVWCLGDGTYSGSIIASYKTAPDSATSTVKVWPDNTWRTMFIGRGSPGNATNTSIALYAASVYRYGNVAAFDTFSDVRLKTNIVPVFDSLKNLRKVNIYEYTMKDDVRHTPRIGVIAQEYGKIFPKYVKKGDNSKYLTVNVDILIYTMLDSIKELDIFVQNTQRKLDDYIKDYLGLKSRVANLEKQLQDARTKNEQMKLHLARINEKLK